MAQSERDRAGAGPIVPVRALIVEDDTLQAMLLAEMLKDLACRHRRWTRPS